MVPVASWTLASTSGRIPRRRTGRARIERTWTATVACSPIASVAMVRASRLSLGRCSSSAPTVSRPSEAKPSAIFPVGSSSGSSSREGRGQKSGAAIIARRESARVEANAKGPRGAARDPRERCPEDVCSRDAAPMASHDDRTRGHKGGQWLAVLLGREQPPVRRLVAVTELELHPAVEHRFDLLEAHGRPLAGEHADELGRRRALAWTRERLEDRAQGLAGVAPREHLVLDEADRISAPEAPQRVVSRRRRDGAGAHPRERLRHRAGVLLHAAAERECERSHEPALL